MKFVTRTEAAQFMACGLCVTFLVEKLLPFVICRPYALAADIPAGDPRIGSGSKCNAVGHHAVRFSPSLPRSRKR